MCMLHEVKNTLTSMRNVEVRNFYAALSLCVFTNVGGVAVRCAMR